ncbi:hypothetical protein [Streptomonospora arabica]|uniref:Transposase n=1 Tax=Streptomonospora arabica TaxID=412417 RepID=A0ABV9SH63_9ACTN
MTGPTARSLGSTGAIPATLRGRARTAAEAFAERHPTVSRTAYATAFVEGYLEGYREGKAECVVSALRHRGLHVSDEVAERISTCTDPDQLDTWMKRALSADTAEDIFD